MPTPSPPSPPWIPRFVAPHFTEVQGSADLPGEVWRACAFTTSAPGAAADATGATHRHHCFLRGPGNGGEKGPGIRWRTESQAVAGGGRRVTEGLAEGLAAAVTAALSAAQTPVEASGGGVLCLAPAFVEMRREPGLPRIWACSHLCEARGITYLQTAFIRAWPGGAGPTFRGTLEILPCMPEPAGAEKAPPLSLRRLSWSAMSLEEALHAWQSHAFAPGAVAGQGPR